MVIFNGGNFHDRSTKTLRVVEFSWFCLICLHNCVMEKFSRGGIFVTKAKSQKARKFTPQAKISTLTVL